MKTKVAINGYGRIGRNILRALYESEARQLIQIVAINDLCEPHINAHLTQYDSIHGYFGCNVTATSEALIVNDDEILVFSERDISALPWDKLDIDVVLECTGQFTERAKAGLHLNAGAKKVLVSAPSADADVTAVYGVNHTTITAADRIISNASCTTNCLAPLAKILNDEFGISSGMMTTVHAFTNDQHLMDGFSGDLYRARAASTSMIPTKTGAAAAVGLVLPELDGKLSGMAVRVPTSNVSLVDLTACLNTCASRDEVNQLVKTAANTRFKGIVAHNEKPLVSIDFNHRPESCIFDATQTIAGDSMIKVFAWYDNEWGFSNRMLDMVRHLYTLDH